MKMIITNPGKINDFIHLVDLRHFGVKRALSCYIGEFDDGIVILDCGSSIDVKKLQRDHIGGISKFYEEVKHYNPDVKIICDPETKDLINNYHVHFNRAKKAYGWLAGKMSPIEDSAFKNIKSLDEICGEISDYKVIDTFKKGSDHYNFVMVKTPGHCSDHTCSLFIKNEQVDFMYIGEALGTFGHSSKLVTWPSSMPPGFKYEEYMRSVENVRTLNAKCIGFAHYGVVQGKNDVRDIINEHKVFMKDFRAKVIEYYKEKPETKYVFEKITPSLLNRVDIGEYINNPLLAKLPLGVIYGMMMDLGYRKE
jgi:glyoxylase-like metal-dependent hydrolase (beta-lactamase superfamily II)